MDLLRTNTFKVVGRLQNQDLKIGNKKSDGTGFISGKAVIISKLDGRDCEFEISFFANQSTKDGKESQLFTSYSKLGDLVGKKVEVTGDVRESRFFSSNANQMVSAQQLSGRFVRGVSETTADEGSFEIGGFVVETLKEKLNKNNEVYRYDLSIGQANYSGNGMNKFVLHVKPTDTEIVNGVRGYQVGQTVSVHGDLRFIVETVVAEKKSEGGFGESVTRTFTNKQHNFFITGGTAAIVDAAKGMYPTDVIKSLVSAYKAHDVELAEKGKSSASSSAIEDAPAVTNRQTSLI